MEGLIIVRFDQTAELNQESAQPARKVVLDGIVSLVPDGFLTKYCGSQVRLTLEMMTPLPAALPDPHSGYDQERP